MIIKKDNNIFKLRESPRIRIRAGNQLCMCDKNNKIKKKINKINKINKIHKINKIKVIKINNKNKNRIIN